MSDTTIRIKQKTYRKLIQVRGKLEAKDGKRRCLNDVINELIDYFEKHHKEEK